MRFLFDTFFYVVWLSIGFPLAILQVLSRGEAGETAWEDLFHMLEDLRDWFLPEIKSG